MIFLIKLALWALAFVPLIVNSSTFFPFIFGKTLMIRIFVSLASLFFTIHLFANEEFRNAMWSKLKRLAKNPLFISATAFMAIMAVGSYFAVNPFRAFFGDVERGEGLLGWLYFYGFFLYSLLAFERKDWTMFFKLNLLTAVALFTKELAEYAGPGTRPGSFTGNPEFLAGYFLFTIFASLIAYYHSDRNREPLWRIFAVIMVPVSLVGLLLTETRGAMLGVVVGLLLLVVYGFFHGKDVRMQNKVSLRTVSMWLLVAMVVAGGMFFATKANPVWQKVPGLSRVAQFSFSGQTVQTRLISVGVSVKAIAPSANGWERTLLGWGQENFSVAYNAYYNPQYYHLEHTWFDRAHNKIMDVAVMNGVLGLAAYLAIWLSIAWFVFRKNGFSADMMFVLFFAGAFFVNLLFLFDQISTVIPLFAFFAFIVYITSLEGETVSQQPGGKRKSNADVVTPKDRIVYGVASGATLLFLWGLIFWTLVPFSQMTSYLGAFNDKNIALIAQRPDDVFEPYTFAQQDMRIHFLNTMVANYGTNPQINAIFDMAVAKMEDLIRQEPSNARALLMIGGAYDKKGKTNNDPAALKKAEGYYKQALALAPGRQDLIYPYALNLTNQGRVQEGIALLRESMRTDSLSPETHYYLGLLLGVTGNQNYKASLSELEIALQSPTFANANDTNIKNAYQTFTRVAYQNRDRESFLTAVMRLKAMDPDQAQMFQRASDLVKAGQWPVINFQ